jgi:hypothetical protein
MARREYGDSAGCRCATVSDIDAPMSGRYACAEADASVYRNASEADGAARLSPMDEAFN